MAKQNFLAGGYIGKLGQTVGQRWKDQKIIRTYVKPANPNTPAQQSARQMFATANKLAQQAMVINGHTGVWDTSTCPEYSQRVGQAMRRLRAGYTEQESLPLYPEGSIPEVQVTITDLRIDNDTQIYTIYTDSYGVSVPTAVELSFYSPEDYLNGTFTEYIIHGTVDATNKTITIDCSANNTTDAEDVKDFFKTAIDFGFVAFYPVFYDVLGTALTEIVMKRGYEVTNVLYDFNKAVPIIDVTQKVVLQQNTVQNSIKGTVAPPVENGFPFIARVSSQNTYFGGFTGNSSQSSFITIDSATPKTFQSAATVGARYLETTNNETIYLQKGLATKQLYRDTSTQTFQDPQITVTLTSVQYTAGSSMVYFTFDNPDALIDVPKVQAQIGYLQQGQAIQDFNPSYRDLTRQADGRYSHDFERNFTAEGKLIIYAYIQALNNDDSLHDVVTISTPDYENGNLLYVSRMPTQKVYPYTLSMFPIDLYRTDGLPLTIAPEKVGGSELYVSLAWGSVGNVETAWRNYSFTAGATETTKTITSTEQVFTDTKEVMFYQLFNIYEEDGRKRVEYTFKAGDTDIDITATTTWTPADGENVTFQFDTGITPWAKQVSAEYYTGIDGTWFVFGDSQQTTLPADGSVTLAVNDPHRYWSADETTYIQPVFKLYDKNGTEVTGLTAGGNTTPTTGRIYFIKTPVYVEGDYPNGVVVAVTDTTIDVQFNGFDRFRDEVRLQSYGELLATETQDLVANVSSQIATVIDTDTIRLQATDIDPAFIGAELDAWSPLVICGTGATTVCYLSRDMA